jgi:hypothetical protein
MARAPALPAATVVASSDGGKRTLKTAPSNAGMINVRPALGGEAI